MHTALRYDDQSSWRPSDEALSLTVGLAVSEGDVKASQRLRYQVFVQELGAQLKGHHEALDCDAYDPFCHHLLVRDSRNGRVIGSTRILTDTQAGCAGGFYSQGEFDLGNILRLPGRMMEVGRTCIDPAYRSGAAIGVLWSGLARFMAMHQFDYLIGCASISLQDGGYTVHRLMERLRAQHFPEPALQVRPHHPLPLPNGGSQVNVLTPPLLKAYLRLGAYVCGEPCWDPDFQVADVFILLDRDKLPHRYQRHFLRATMAPAVVHHAHAKPKTHV